MCEIEADARAAVTVIKVSYFMVSLFDIRHHLAVNVQ